jgi:hypothetical protein
MLFKTAPANRSSRLRPESAVFTRATWCSLVIFGAALLLVQAAIADPGEWELTGGLKTARFHHTATLLPDGRVLVAGGEDGSDPLASVELYDPASGTWSATASLSTARDSHTATLLPDGMVLVAGGRETIPGISLASAELYDPASGTWSPTGRLNTGRVFHTATLLQNGMVLVAGGKETGISLASAELYDPASGTWSPTGRLNTGRVFHTATLLTNGKVLVTGGRDSRLVGLGSAELYDPATGTWSVTGSLNPARYDHTATLLSNGMVLVAGGNPDGLDSAELYNPATGTWSATDNLNEGRVDHTATLLLKGTVLVAGGASSGNAPLASAELYDPGIVVATQVDGRGTFDNQGNEVTFNFHVNQPEGSSSAGDFSFCDPAAGVCITTGKTQSLSITGISAEFSGKARLEDGTRVTFSVSVTDNGEPGRLDTISISLSNGYLAGGTLTSGDIRLH